MSDKSRVVVNSGPSVLGILGVAFVVLKLCGVIQWSWLIVTMPFWIVPAVLLVVLFSLAAFWGVARAIDGHSEAAEMNIIKRGTPTTTR